MKFMQQLHLAVKVPECAFEYLRCRIWAIRPCKTDLIRRIAMSNQSHFGGANLGLPPTGENTVQRTN